MSGRALVFAACLLSSALLAQPESTPETQGVDSEDLVRLVHYIDGQAKGLDSLVMIRHGHVIFEVYYEPYGRDEVHILNSVTKSFVSALIGIAIDKGYLPNDENKLADWFPKAAADRKAAIDIRHLLTMTSGIDWPQYGRNNVSRQMDESPNWVQFILNRPMAHDPGTQSNYSNGDAHLLSAVLQRATGESALEFGWKHLFQPLGIPKPRWDHDPQGINIGSATIYMTPRDMAKLGMLYMHHGAWQGTQIVPEVWVRKSLKRNTSIEISAGQADYGYYWWLYPALGMSEAWGGAGQRIAVFENLDLVTVMTGDISDDAPVTSFSSEIYNRILRAVKDSSSLAENAPALAELRRLLAGPARSRPKRSFWDANGSLPVAVAALVAAVAGTLWWRARSAA